MTTVQLSHQQSSIFFKKVFDDTNLLRLDEYLYEKYSIVKRKWKGNVCELTFEDEKYISWILLL